MSRGPSWRKEKPRSRIVDLERRNAKVEDHAIELGHAGLVQQRDHVAELAVQQMQPARKMGHEAGTALDRLGIAVDRPERAACLLQDGARIAAAAEGAVEIDAAVAGREARQHLIQHHGNVTAHAASPAADAPARTLKPDAFALARAAARRRAPASGSQI